MHIAEIQPGKSRGNHFHKKKKELIFVLSNDTWNLQWLQCNDKIIHKETFSEPGATLIEINPNYVHSIENTGNSKLIIYAMSNEKYSLITPDTFPYKIIQE